MIPGFGWRALRRAFPPKLSRALITSLPIVTVVTTRGARRSAPSDRRIGSGSRFELGHPVGKARAERTADDHELITTVPDRDGIGNLFQLVRQEPEHFVSGCHAEAIVPPAEASQVEERHLDRGITEAADLRVQAFKVRHVAEEWQLRPSVALLRGKLRPAGSSVRVSNRSTSIVSQPVSGPYAVQNPARPPSCQQSPAPHHPNP